MNAIEKAGLITEAERDSITGGLNTVCYSSTACKRTG